MARGAHGGEALTALFWHNIVGRFTQLSAPAGLDYTTGHQNTPGKYLLELPLYLLPWTLVVAAALARAWRRILTVEGAQPGAGVEVIEHALAALSEAAARRAELAPA